MLKALIGMICIGALSYGAYALVDEVDAQVEQVEVNGNESVEAAQFAPLSFSQRDALVGGIDFLVSHQNEDGSFGTPLKRRPADIYLGGINSLHAFHNATSALCAMALLEQPYSTPEREAALVKAYQFLIDAREVGRVSSDTFYNSWTHAYMLEAIARGLQDGRLQPQHEALRARGQDELRRLIRLQSLNGGWGYYDFREKLGTPSGDYSTPFNTSAAIEAMRAARKVGFEIPQAVLDRAVAFVGTLRTPYNSFSYSAGHRYYPYGAPNKPQGSIGRTQLPMYVLIDGGAEGVGVEDASYVLNDFFKLHHFIEIGRQRQYPHEAWYATAPYYYYHGHYGASRILRVLPHEERVQGARKLANLIAITADNDGCFWDYPLYGFHKAYGTAYAVLALTECAAAEAEAVVSR